jgi:hypothetical protein
MTLFIKGAHFRADQAEPMWKSRQQVLCNSVARGLRVYRQLKIKRCGKCLLKRFCVVTVESIQLNPFRQSQRLASTEVVNPKLAVIETAIFSVLDKRLDFLFGQN